MVKGLIILVFLILSDVSAQAQSKQFTIFDIRRNLPLTENEQVYRDYYVNLGTDDGVKEGAVLAVYRRLPVTDVYRNKTHTDLVVPLGHIKVILAQRSMSVARLASLVDQAQIPVVQYEKIMLGDRVELSSQLAADSKPLAPKSEVPLETKELTPQTPQVLPARKAAAAPVEVKPN